MHQPVHQERKVFCWLDLIHDSERLTRYLVMIYNIQTMITELKVDTKSNNT